jgi:exodeoxyribonuclease VII large subunit
MINKEEHFKLSNIMNEISMSVTDRFPHAIWIEAEITSISKHSQSGHYYLELLETDTKGNEVCKNRASIWSSKANILLEKFKTNTGSDLKAGLKVLVKCKISFHPKYQLSINIEDINPEFTLGGMEVKIKEILLKLEKNNIINKNKDLKVPFDFHRVAVVAPSGAAGLGDFKKDADILEKFNICQFDYYDAIFQGKDTKESVTTAILKSLNSNIEYDILIVLRGGGAKTDLHFLNEYEIAEAICNSKIPVFVGVGHERDKGVLDSVANISFDTPSKVIGHIFTVVVNNATINKTNITKIMQSSKLLVSKHKNEVERNYALINTSAKRNLDKFKLDVENKLLVITKDSKNKINDFVHKITSSVDKTVIIAKNNLKTYQLAINERKTYILNQSKLLLSTTNKEIINLDKIIQGFKPDYILNLGFVIAKQNGKVVKDISEINKDETLQLVFKNGSINVKITGDNEND